MRRRGGERGAQGLRKRPGPPRMGARARLDYVQGRAGSAPGWPADPTRAAVPSNDAAGETSGDTAREARQLRIGGSGLPQEVVGEQRVRQIEESLERAPQLARGEGQLVAREALEQQVEFFRSAAATPEQ